MMVNAICAQSGPAIDWLISSHNIELSLVEGFLYPGHSKLRMHAPASRLGSDLMDSLSAACSRASIDVLATRRLAICLLIARATSGAFKSRVAMVQLN